MQSDETRISEDRREALRYSRWMLERLTAVYSQGETPHLPL